jgi:hypothetical protein
MTDKETDRRMALVMRKKFMFCQHTIQPTVQPTQSHFLPDACAPRGSQRYQERHDGLLIEWRQLLIQGSALECLSCVHFDSVVQS